MLNFLIDENYTSKTCCSMRGYINNTGRKKLWYVLNVIPK